MRVLPAILANIILFAAAFGYGHLLRGLFPQSFSVLDRLAFTLMAGLGLLGTVLFCIGEFWFSRSAILLVLIPGVVLCLRPTLHALINSRATLSEICVPLLPALIVATVLLVTAVGGLALPTGDMNNDSIAYHYLGPKVWLRDHRVHPVPDEILTSFPALVETQYAALMSLGGQRAPQFFALTSLITILLVTAGLAVRLGLDQSSVWWTAAIILTMPALYRGAYGGFLDVLFAAFVLAAGRIAFDAETPRHYALFGLFCGFAMSTKYTALISFVLLIFCCLVVSLWTRHPHPCVLPAKLAISCVVAVIVSAPFYVRNWFLFGSPIYPPPPILLRLFAVPSLLPPVLHELEKNVRETGAGMGSGLRHFLLLPFNLTYHTSNFRGAGGIGLMPLALGPFGVVASRRDAFAKGLLLFAFLQTAAWFTTAQVSRYLIPAYVIAALFAVIGWQKVTTNVSSQLARMLSALIVACSVIYGLMIILPDRRADIHAALSSSFETQRLNREIPFLASFDYLNKDPSVTKILIVDPYVAAYYSDKDYIKPVGRWGEQTLPRATDLPHILETLPQLRVSHVLDVKSSAGAFRLPDNPPALALVFQRDDQRVYRVN
jgi:hypothetical protein